MLLLLITFPVQPYTCVEAGKHAQELRNMMLLSPSLVCPQCLKRHHE